MIRTTSLAVALTLVLATPLASAAAQDIDKVNGSIHAQAGQQYGTLETVNGSINIDDGVGIGHAETVNGSIRGGNDVRSGDLETVNGAIHLGTGAQVGGLETVNGGVFVDRGGRVGKGVTTVNGAIGLVGTDVASGLETVNGDITVGVNSHVHGGIHVEKNNTHGWNIHFTKQRPPRIIVGPGATVDGPLVFEREVVLYVHDSAKIGPVTGATVRHFSGDHAPEE